MIGLILVLVLGLGLLYLLEINAPGWATVLQASLVIIAILQMRRLGLMEEKALELWRHWFDFSGDPWQCDDYGRTHCFFCLRDHPNHDVECVYVLAARLVGRDLVTEVGI